MSSAELPRDLRANPIPVLGVVASHGIPAQSSSARNGTAFDSGTKVITVIGTVDLWVKLGDGSVVIGSVPSAPYSSTAAPIFIPAGLPVDLSIKDTSGYLAVIRAGSTDGIAFVWERQ